MFGGSFKKQNALLLIGSYVFYGWWDLRFLFLIVVTTVVDFNTGLIVGEGKSEEKSRWQSFALLLGAALFFATINWGALGGKAENVLPTEWTGWLPLALSLFGVTALQVMHPRLVSLEESTRRKVALAISITTNLGILAVFKYFNFFAESFSQLAQDVFSSTPGDLTLNIVLPVGISFYTFQSMSYTIDTYRGDVKPTRSIVDFAAFLAFFPQLVAGPIERGKHLLPQFQRPRTVTPEQRDSGLWLIAWGLFKKVVVADNVALIVNRSFAPFDGSAPSSVVPEDGLRLAVAVFAFAFQIYADFSGYTDVARGIARLLGFDIMVNFRLPYFARSPSEFWQRWHISLSTWLRDYLYIPLGGNRGGLFFTQRNLMITMVLGGLWHGAAWNFVFWGFYHGTLLALYRIAGVRGHDNQSVAKSIGQGTLMFALTLYGWLLFRAQNTTAVGVFTQAIFASPGWSAQAQTDLLDVLFYVWPLVAFQIFQAVTKNLEPLIHLHRAARHPIWVFVVMSIFALASSGGQEFIYFAF